LVQPVPTERLGAAICVLVQFAWDRGQHPHQIRGQRRNVHPNAGLLNICLWISTSWFDGNEYCYCFPSSLPVAVGLACTLVVPLNRGKLRVYEKLCVFA
jgi:hypothetical protein